MTVASGLSADSGLGSSGSESAIVPGKIRSASPFMGAGLMGWAGSSCSEGMAAMR